MENLKKRIIDYLKENGAGDVGFCNIKGDENPFGLSSCVSFTIPLSDAIVNTITDAPTHTYFHHYRTINAHIDRISLNVGFMLEKEGYLYVPVPASQSVEGTYGIFSHKYGATLSGLGAVGKSGLFISKSHGPRVRLGSILTDCDFKVSNKEEKCPCSDCRLCALSCPAQAISGEMWVAGDERSVIVDAKACSDYMKKAYQHIGRGAVCGICMNVCPLGKKG